MKQVVVVMFQPHSELNSTRLSHQNIRRGWEHLTSCAFMAIYQSYREVNQMANVRKDVRIRYGVIVLAQSNRVQCAYKSAVSFFLLKMPASRSWKLGSCILCLMTIQKKRETEEQRGLSKWGLYAPPQVEHRDSIFSLELELSEFTGILNGTEPNPATVRTVGYANNALWPPPHRDPPRSWQQCDRPGLEPCCPVPHIRLAAELGRHGYT